MLNYVWFRFFGLENIELGVANGIRLARLDGYDVYICNS